VKESQNDIIIGRNPVIEALKAGREIEKICLAKGTTGSTAKIIAIAAEKNIPVRYEENRILDKLTTGNHQGVVAYVSAYRYCETEDIIKRAESLGEEPFIVLLAGIEDPQNLGSIIRTAEAAGVHGIIIPKRRAVGITAAAVKASAGAAEHMLCARVANIAQTIDKLKDAGLWIWACDTGGEPYYDSDLKGGVGLLIGGEGSGIGNLIKEKCDFILSIPMRGKIGSLNAANAASVLMYEVLRQRNG